MTIRPPENARPPAELPPEPNLKARMMLLNFQNPAGHPTREAAAAHLKAIETSPAECLGLLPRLVPMLKPNRSMDLMSEVWDDMRFEGARHVCRLIIEAVSEVTE